MLIGDRVGDVFLDIWPVLPDGAPRLPLVPVFLALAWASPARYVEPKRTIGLPDVLMIPKKDLKPATLVTLESLAGKLDFKLEHPQHGFDAGAHRAKKITLALDDITTREVNGSITKNLRLLSKVVAGYIAAHPNLFTIIRSGGSAPVRHREIPDDVLDWAAASHELSVDELKACAAPYFKLPA